MFVISDQIITQKEEERIAKEIQEKREHEEYLLLKESFAVEDEGQEALDEETQRNLLLEFIGEGYESAGSGPAFRVYR